jgi:hypothetical protein
VPDRPWRAWTSAAGRRLLKQAKPLPGLVGFAGGPQVARFVLLRGLTVSPRLVRHSRNAANATNVTSAAVASDGLSVTSWGWECAAGGTHEEQPCWVLS